MKNRTRIILLILVAVATSLVAPHFYRRHFGGAVSTTPLPPGAVTALSADTRQPASLPNPLSPSANLCDSLYHIACSHRGVTRDPTGIVRPDLEGEKIADGIYEELIRDHPDWESDKLDEALVDRIYTPARTGRVQVAYRWVLNAIERFIDRQPERVFTAHEKKSLKNRLKRTQLQLPPPAHIYDDEPDLYTKSEVYYERLVDNQTRMRVGGAYLLNSESWFNIVFTMAHELAHSIDPCEIRAARLSLPAYDHLSACFLAHGLIAARNTRAECGADDQLSETFADWIAVYVSAEALRAFSMEFHGRNVLNAATNSVRDLCEQDGADLVDEEFHPPPRVRIDRIYARNPEIREVLGCGTLSGGLPYCGFDWEIPVILKRTK